MNNIEIPPFYIGQEVVAISNTDTWKKGDEFIVLGIEKKCCSWVIDIGINCNTCCSEHNRKFIGAWFKTICFRAKVEIEDFVSMKDIAELALETIGAN